MDTQSKTAQLFDLKGKVAMIIGATGRLGREISYALAESGADLVIVARTAEALQTLEQTLKADTGRKVLSITADTQHETAIQAMFQTVQQHYKTLDILVNNVTGNARETVETLSEAQWDEALHHTVTGMFLCCKGAGEIMARQKRGSIINIASIYGVVAADQRIYGDSGLNSSVVYGTGKAGVIHLSKYLAAYWANAGVRVNTLTPGGVEDVVNEHPVFRSNYEGRTPMQRMMQREEIRGPVVFLASDASSYVTGHNLMVDGGFTII